MSHENDPPLIGNTEDTVEVSVPKGFITADGNMEPEIESLAAPEADPQHFAMDATGPIQTWTNEHVILPNIGDVDAKLLGLGGLSNTIVVSTTTAELLATITVNIGSNGNWFVGDVDTGVPASGTDPESILRMVGAYIQAPMSYDVPSALMTVAVGGHYVAYNGIAEGYVQFMVTGIITATIAASTKVVSMDSAGVTYQHTSPDLLLIPESQVILATFDGSDPARVMTIFPTVHQMVYELQGVVSELDGKVAEAEAWAIAAAASASEAGGYAVDAQNSAIAAAASETQTGLDAVATAADRVQTGLDATATAADRVQTGLDVTATAADRVATDADTVQTAADRVQTTADAASALDSKNLASEYAMNPEDTPITGHPTDRSAYHWSEKARQSAESVLSGVHYKGQWDASLGAFPTPPVGPVEVVDYYRISAAGTMTGTGAQQPVTTAVGDTLYWDSVSDVWYEMESGDSVRTVNSKLPDAFGNINITIADTGGAPLVHTHTIAQVTGLQTRLDVSVERITPTGPVDMVIGTTATRPDTSQPPYDTKALLWFNSTTGGYEAWNPVEQEWGAVGGGGGKTTLFEVDRASPVTNVPLNDSMLNYDDIQIYAHEGNITGTVISSPVDIIGKVMWVLNYTSSRHVYTNPSSTASNLVCTVAGSNAGVYKVIGINY